MPVFSWSGEMYLKWRFDSDAAKVITSMGLSHETGIITAAVIDVTKSRHNHARAAGMALISNNVEDYHDAMERGDEFPSIVVARIDDGAKYVIAGGNHRHAAAVKLGVSEFEAIIVRCTAMEFDLLCPKLNMYVGQMEGRDARVEAAADRVVRMGITHKLAAQEFRVSVGQVGDAVRMRAGEAAAARLGHSITSMNAANVRLLSSIRENDNELNAAILYAKTNPTSTEMAHIIKTVKLLGTEGERVRAIENETAARKKVTANGRITKTPVRSSILRASKTLSNIASNGVTLCQLQMTQIEVEEMMIELARVLRALSVAK